jgi:RimJ/RimL family protein N-acetyltransferase
MLPDGQEMFPESLRPLTFESSRLIYRGVEKEDLDFFYKVSQDTIAVYALNPNLPLPNSKKSSEDLMAFIKEHALLEAIICLRPDSAVEDASKTPSGAPASDKKPSEPVPIGHIMLAKSTPTMAHHRHGEIGIGMLPEYRNKGYGAEAIKWILEWGFQMANMHRIFLTCHGWNEGAAKLYRKLGFQHEGTKREHLWFNGRWYDALEFSMLEHEWKDLQKKAS